MIRWIFKAQFPSWNSARQSIRNPSSILHLLLRSVYSPTITWIMTLPCRYLPVLQTHRIYWRHSPCVCQHGRLCRHIIEPRTTHPAVPTSAGKVHNQETGDSHNIIKLASQISHQQKHPYITGAHHRSHPKKLRMEDRIPKPTLSPENLNGRTDEDAPPLSEYNYATYNQTLGDIRFIVDSMRPDIYHTAKSTSDVPANDHRSPLIPD